MFRTFFCSLFIALVVPAIATAEIAPQTPSQLQARASDIATGLVEAIYIDQTKETQWTKTAGVVEIRVDQVDKGDSLQPGQRVYARFWRLQWTGQGNPPTYGSGHRLPRKGDRVRVYLKQEDGGYSALLPNGFERLDK